MTVMNDSNIVIKRRMQMTVKNKWNNRIYTIVMDKGSSITLKRGDGSIFEISKDEFHKSYRKLEDR